jgi:two-component system NtrC family sensor kinase
VKNFDLFSTEGFMPHGHCYLWRPEILWLNVVSDAIIFLAYMMIPVTIFLMLRKRPLVPYKWILFMFGLFITACGFTHLASIITIWDPYYGVEGILKAITAAISIATALLTMPLAPRAFDFLMEKSESE